MSQPVHPIQAAIFETLRTKPTGLRFSELRPADVESDLFNYHLKQLVSAGHVEKLDAGYRLTKAGKEFLVDAAPLENGLPPRLKIAAMCLVSRVNSAGQLEMLYQKRKREPHLGSMVMVAGGIRRGEPVLAAARRRLKEEAGLSADFVWVGTLRKLRKRPSSNFVWSDITYHICAAQNVSGEPADTPFGTHEWVSPERAAELESTQSVGNPFLAKFVLQLASNAQTINQHFYIEEETISDIW